MSFGDSRLFSFSDCRSHSSAMSHHQSVPPSITSSHRTQSCLSCPSMQCPSSPHKPADIQSQTGRKALDRGTHGVKKKQKLMLIIFPAALFQFDLLCRNCCFVSAVVVCPSLCVSLSFFYFMGFFFVSTFLFLCLLHSAPASVFTSVPVVPPSSSSTHTTAFPFHPLPTAVRTRCQGSRGVGFSLAEVHQELQMLQRQLGHSERASDCTVSA